MRLAEKHGLEIDAGYAAEYPLAQAPAIEVSAISSKRRLAVGAAVEIVEKDLRDFRLRSTSEILDVNDAHSFSSTAWPMEVTPFRIPCDVRRGSASQLEGESP